MVDLSPFQENKNHPQKFLLQLFKSETINFLSSISAPRGVAAWIFTSLTKFMSLYLHVLDLMKFRITLHSGPEKVKIDVVH